MSRPLPGMYIHANVSGCPPRHDVTDTSLDENCINEKDGKLYAYSHTGPYSALMKTDMSSHAACLLELPDGAILLVWFSGAEGSAGVGIVGSRLEPGSRQWSEPINVSFVEGRSNQNPIIFLDPEDGYVYCFHTSQGGGEGQGTSYILRVVSIDGGRTWGRATKVESLSTGNGPFVKGRIILSKDRSEWLLPMYFTPTMADSGRSHYSAMRRSSDKGITWSEEVPMSSMEQFLVQPSVVRIPQTGTLRAFFRDRQARWVYTTTSTDDGASWSLRHHHLPVPNNNAGIQVDVLQSGRLVMAFNNRQGPWRCPLTLALSDTEGLTWAYMRDVELGCNLDTVLPVQKPGKRGRKAFWEYSYPTVMQTHDGHIHVAYTYRRQTIKHVVVDEAWIMSGTSIGGPFPPWTRDTPQQVLLPRKRRRCAVCKWMDAVKQQQQLKKKRGIVHNADKLRGRLL